MPNIGTPISRPWQPKGKQWTGLKREFKYNSVAWRNLSRSFRQEHPLCVECERHGLTVMATVTDHITPINKGGDPWSWDNLQGLCTHHNATKTGRDK
jgi:5-methylcytosine-specific restriction enzyme A